MTPRVLLMCLFLVAGGLARAAELMIEITQGSDDPTKIAVIPSISAYTP